MPMTAQVERLATVRAEIAQQLGDHYDELSLHKARGVPVEPHWPLYEALDASGHLLIVTLRDEARALVGYYVGFVMGHPHYAGCLHCLTDVFRVVPGVRGHHGGIRLFREVERQLRARGVKNWIVSTKVHLDCGRLLTAIGMKPIEHAYGKWLGE